MRSFSQLSLHICCAVTLLAVYGYSLLPDELKRINLSVEVYVSCFLVIFAVILLQEQNLRARLCFFLLACWGALNLCMSDIPKEVKCLERFSGFLIVSFVLSLGRGMWLKQYRISMLNYFFLFSAFCCLISFLLYLSGINLPWSADTNYHGVFNHSMVLGPISGMVTIYLLSQSMYKVGRWKKICFLLAVVAFLCCLLSASRAAAGAMLVGIAVILFYSPWKKIILYVLLLFVVIIFASKMNVEDIGQAKYVENLWQKHENNMNMGGITASREELWNILLDDIKAHPIVGCGFGNMGGGKLEIEGRVEPGCSWLFAWSSLGIVGFMTMIYLWWGTALRLFNLPEKNQRIAMLLALLCFSIVHMFAEGYIFSMGSGLFFVVWLVLGNCIDCLEEYRNDWYPAVAKKTGQVKIS